MNEVLCIKCGYPAAFPTAVKQPYTCLTCQPPEQKETPLEATKPAALSSSALLAAIGDGATLPEIADKLGMMVVEKHPKRELCDAIMHHLMDGKLTMDGNKLKAAKGDL